MHVNPFRIPLKNRLLAGLAERALGLTPLAYHYDRRPHLTDMNAAEFLDYTLEALKVDTELENSELLDQVPRRGSLIFVANHPLGGLEGVALTQALLKVRPDLLVLTNEMLTRVKELSSIFVGVDVLSKNAEAKNAKGMRAVCKHLSKGGAILIFPAGMVSAIDTKDWRIRDREWDQTVGRLMQKYQATCVPLYVYGRNSKLFYAAGLIHPRLRTVLLPRQLANKAGKTLSYKLGAPIPPEEIQKLQDPKQITDYLRLATDLLNAADAEGTQVESRPLQNIEKFHNEQQLMQDVAKLEDCILLQKNGFTVYCAPFDRLNSVMDEIAYARELTFRAVGEGTGLAFDSDEYDPHYLHLFLWDDDKQALVGGYRMGRVDEIVAQHGVKALYSRKHYKFDAAYIARFGKALEMGRSFVKPEYQKHPRALDLLWQGIGAYVAKHPGYPLLFGCVSISQEHSQAARALLSDSMLQNFRADPEYLKDVRPMVSLKNRGKLWCADALASIADITTLNKLVGRCDPGKTIPVLLRQYLTLNGRIVCFSVNTGFNNSLDGLILVDLRKSPEKYIKRYLGKEGSEAFIKYWSKHDLVA